ncbi:MAG: outer membrane beta-barrel protein [Waterburya sp.]
MKIKAAILTIIVVTSFPLTVQAQSPENYKNYQVNCHSDKECKDLKVIYENNQTAQKTSRDHNNNTINKYYAGGSIGLFLAGDFASTEVNGGFSFSGLVGNRFSNKISAELEILDYVVGESTFVDFADNFLGIAVNAALRFYFNPDNTRSAYIFGAGGLGYGGFVNSGSGFLFQGKTGLAFPISDSLDIYGQYRYLNLLVNDGSDGSANSLELGTIFGF